MREEMPGGMGGKDVRVSPSSPGRPDVFILFSLGGGASRQTQAMGQLLPFPLRNPPSKPNSQKTQRKGVRIRTTTTPWITKGGSRGKEMAKYGTGWSRTGQKPGLWPGINLYPELGAVAVESQSRQLAPATDHEAHLGDEKGNKVM